MNLYFNDDQDGLGQVGNKITLLSRQLRTYLNLKGSTIKNICKDIANPPNIPNIQLVQRLEGDLNQVYHGYRAYVNKFIKPNENLKLQFMVLAKKAYSCPNTFETKLFNQFLRNRLRLWELVHILTDLEIQNKPQLLKRLIQISYKLCNAERALNTTIPDFFQQLWHNYHQLYIEYEQLVLVKRVEKEDIKNNKVMVLK